MRIRFRTKILLALILCVGGLLAAALANIDRAFTRQIAAMRDERVAQGKRTFGNHIAQLNEQLRKDALVLAALARMQEAVSQKGPMEVREIVLNELEARLMSHEFVVVADKEGVSLTRLLSRDGRMEDSRGTAEHAIVLKSIRSTDPLDGFIVVEGRLIRVATAQSVLGNKLRFILVLGSEIRDETVERINDAQAKDDEAGYVVDGALVASSIPIDQRAGLAGRLTEAGMLDMTVNGHPYLVDLEPVERSDSDRKAYTAIFISLRKLLQARAQMTREVLVVGVAGLAIAVVLGLMISSGVTAPVRDLVEGTVRVAGGEYSHRIAVRTSDELGDLAGAFNKMAGDLATKEKMRAVLNKVVAPQVAEELLKSDLALGGDLVRATLLFADLRGFTSLTQGMPAPKIVAMLNEFMTEMHREVLACSGIVDKYVGDEMIALFGVPRTLGHDAFAAVEAAHRMRERLVTLNARRGQRGECPLAMGIGIHTGEVVAGRMGSEEQLNYTCIGEAVNLASRLCSNAKAGQILISLETLNEAGDNIEARPLDPITVKGFSKPVPIYEVVRVDVGETSRRRDTAVRR